MIWKFCHLLFGWDYVAWRNTADQGVARVFNDGSGRTFYWRYKITGVADQIMDAEQVMWLTCPPDKYLRRSERSSKA